MPVHILVIPKRHLASLDEVGDGTVMAPVFALAAQVAREQGLDKTGWRAVINTGRDANQVVLHVHLHVFAGRRMSWPPRSPASRGSARNATARPLVSRTGPCTGPPIDACRR